MYQNQGGREYQQDAMAIKQFGSLGVLAVLADGMGGYEGGEIASRLASEKMREFTIEGEDVGASLRKSLENANEAIRAYKQEHPEVQSMGTTLIACFMSDESCQWISVGDSPLWLIRNRSQIERINANHSIAGLLDLQVRNGEISAEEARSNPQRHMLTSAVSGEEIPTVDLSTPLRLHKDDLLILASDGIETLEPERILEIVRAHVPVTTQENIQQAAEALVREVIATGKPNQDNVTVILLGYLEDREPPTRFYGAAEEKKPWLWAGLGVVAIALVLFLLFSWWKGAHPARTSDPTAAGATVAMPAARSAQSPAASPASEAPRQKDQQKPKAPQKVQESSSPTEGKDAPSETKRPAEPKTAKTSAQREVDAKQTTPPQPKKPEKAVEPASGGARKIHIEIKDATQ
jgi:protein phosphatase